MLDAASGIKKKKIGEEISDIKNHPEYLSCIKMLVLVLKYISTCSYHLGVCWKEQKLGIPASWFWSIFIKFVFVVQKSKHFHYVSAQYAQWSSICCSRLKQWFSILAKRLTRFVVTLPLADWREIIQHVHIYNSVSWCLTRASTSLFIKSALAEYCQLKNSKPFCKCVLKHAGFEKFDWYTTVFRILHVNNLMFKDVIVVFDYYFLLLAD